MFSNENFKLSQTKVHSQNGSISRDIYAASSSQELKSSTQIKLSSDAFNSCSKVSQILCITSSKTLRTPMLIESTAGVSSTFSSDFQDASITDNKVLGSKISIKPSLIALKNCSWGSQGSYFILNEVPENMYSSETLKVCSNGSQGSYSTHKDVQKLLEPNKPLLNADNDRSKGFQTSDLTFVENKKITTPLDPFSGKFNELSKAIQDTNSPYEKNLPTNLLIASIPDDLRINYPCLTFSDDIKSNITKQLFSETFNTYSKMMNVSDTSSNAFFSGENTEEYFKQNEELSKFQSNKTITNLHDLKRISNTANKNCDDNNDSVLITIKKKKAFIKKFNCFKTSNMKQKVCKQISINTTFYPEKGLSFANDNYRGKPKDFYDIIKAQQYKMSFPIKKETENLLFVANKYISKFLLGPLNPEDKNKKCCVIDLDETLVHSSFKPLPRYDFKINVDIEGNHYDIFIIKRPFVDLFLNKMGKLFECVLFTASLAKYANLVANSLDKSNIFRWRLYRESCVYYRGGFVKDLSMLGRPMDQIVILDNSPMSFLFNAKNAIHVISWFDDPDDKALLDLIPYCERLANSSSVLKFLQLEQPPPSAAWPMQTTFTLVAPSLTSKNSSKDSLQYKNDINPITSLNASLITSRKGPSNSNRNYSDKPRSQTLAPLIRNFLSKTLGSKSSNDNDKSSLASTSDSKVSVEPSEFYKNNITRSSLSTLSIISKPSQKSTSVQSPTQTNIINESLKIVPQSLFLKEDI